MFHGGVGASGWLQIYLTRIGSISHHRSRRAMEPKSTVVVETGGSEEKLISDLRPFSEYEVAVTVFNSKGEGPLSDPLSFNTDEGGKRARRTQGVDLARVPRLEWEEAEWRFNYEGRNERQSDMGNGNEQRRGRGRGDDDDVPRVTEQ